VKYSFKIVLCCAILTAVLGCQKENQDLLGVYAVHDAITGPPAMDWYFESYDIEISKSGVISKTFHIVNYANKNSSFNGTQFKVACEIADQAFIIRAQEVDGRRVHETAGYFLNDPIFFDISYANAFGEVYVGHCFGVKK